MIGTVIGLIFLIVILGVVWWGANQLLVLIPMSPPFRTIVNVLLVVLLVIVVLYVLIQLLGLAGIHVPTGLPASR